MSRIGDWWVRNFGAELDEPDGTVLVEARPTATTDDGPRAVARTGYEYGIPHGGINEVNAGIGQAGQADRRSQLNQQYEAFLTCPWAWAAVNAIARTITGGGLVFDWDQDDGEGDQEQPEKPAEVLAAERLFRYVNPREDIRQLLRGVIADLLVFGDAFIEVVWLGNIPVALFSLDAPSMFPVADEHGTILSYVQVTELGQRADFETREIIHISLDAPRSGIFGVSPTQAALLPITSWLFASATLKEIYRKGDPPIVHADLPQSYSQPEINRWQARYKTENLGPKNIGTPLTTKGGGTITELQQSRIENLLHALDQKRDEILSTYGVPPAEAGVIESGNIGGGTGESQRKSFLVNTCNPIAALVLEKLEYALVKKGFGVTGWHLKFDEVDMRDSKLIEDIRDMRLRNGSWTLDRYRAEIGEPPVEGGANAVLVDRQNLVLWRDMEVYSTAGVASKLNGTGLELDDPAEPGQGDQGRVKLLKPEPEPVPDALQGFAGQNNPPATPGAPPGLEDDGNDEEDPKGGPTPPQTGPKPPSKGRPPRPPRESWNTYQARVREAMSELAGAA
jgi:phage portal protein BeeE